MYSYPIDGGNSSIYAVAPNPPTAEAVKKAQFVDKTYIWKNAGIRSGDGRSSK